MESRSVLGNGDCFEVSETSTRGGSLRHAGRLARSLFAVVVATTVAAGCDGPPSVGQQLTVARSALSAPPSEVFGFENPADWSTSTTGAVLSQSSTHSQGSFSLQVQPSNSNGYTPIVSAPLTTLTGVSPTLAWDVMLPTQEPNPNWFGTAQMYLNCPSRNIYSAFLGQVELTGKPLNVWNTVSFPLTNAEVTGLLQTGYSDLTITVVLNVQVPTTGVYFIDNLRFIPAPMNGCGGWPNGTSCTDGNACTQTDTCQSGACVGSNPVVCTAQDQCHVVGTCSPSTGACSNPAVSDGTTCSDGNACTQTDKCVAGVCTGSNPIVCPAVDQCLAGACDPSSGSCTSVPVTNGTSCNDGNACTTGDTCQGGVCGGTLDSVCQLSIRFEEVVDLGNGTKTAIFSYTNPGPSPISVPYGSSNFISVNGSMVAAASQVPTSFSPGDNPGALSFPLPAGATTVSWTVGAHVATSTGSAQALGTTSTGAPAVTVTNAAGAPMLVAFDVADADVSQGVVFSVADTALTVPQGGSVQTTLSVEYLGGYTNPNPFAFVDTDIGPPGAPSGLNDGFFPIGTQKPVSAYNWVFQADAAALLGVNNIGVTVANLIPNGAPTASITVTVVPPPVTTINAASLSMKGPLLMLADQPWALNDIPQDFLTTTPIPPSFQSGEAPHWVSGDGYTVQDNNGSAPLPLIGGIPEVLVRNANVNFQANLAFTDDTSALQLTATAEPGDQSNVGTGHTSCTSSLFPGVVEGNHGHYTVRVQRWDESSTNCEPDEVQTNGTQPKITYSSPSPTDRPGCWVDMASATSDMYGSQPLPDVLGLGINGPIASQDGTVTGVLSIPATLTQIVTYVRYLVTLTEADTRVPNDTTACAWSILQGGNPSQTSCEALTNTQLTPLFPPDEVPETGEGYDCFSPGGTPSPFVAIEQNAIAPFCPPAVPNETNEGPEAHWVVGRPGVPVTGTSGGFNVKTAMNPFVVVLEPVAVAQLKVLPFTILYQPPGDKSSAQYSLTQSFGTTMTTTNVLNTSQSTNVDNKVTDGDMASTGMTGLSYKNLTTNVPSLALGMPGMNGMPGNGVNTFFNNMNFTISDTISTSQTWDDSVTLGSGRSTTAATSQSATSQLVLGWTLCKSGCNDAVPGAGGSYPTEAFWGDTIVALIHPQIGVWQAGGLNSIVLLGAQGGVNATNVNIPNFFIATVSELFQCATQAPGFENGMPMNSTHTDSTGTAVHDDTDILFAPDCQQLLQLDPFYPVGQTLPGAPNTREALITTSPYGTDGNPALGTHFDAQFNLTENLTYTNVMTGTNVTSFNSAATNVFTSSTSNSFSVGAFGFSVGNSSTSSNSTGNTDSLQIQYQTSSAATAQSSISVVGSLDDDHVLPMKPFAFVYQDTAFGSWMFQDQQAPTQPQP